MSCISPNFIVCFVPRLGYGGQRQEMKKLLLICIFLFPIATFGAVPTTAVSSYSATPSLALTLATNEVAEIWGNGVCYANSVNPATVRLRYGGTILDSVTDMAGASGVQPPGIGFHLTGYLSSATTTVITMTNDCNSGLVASVSRVGYIIFPDLSSGGGGGGSTATTTVEFESDAFDIFYLFFGTICLMFSLAFITWYFKPQKI